MLKAVIGLLSGVLSGMGVGGGMILIPSLILLCNINQHSAQTTNLYYFIPTAIAALIIHIKNKVINIKACLSMAAAGIVFSALGAFWAVRMSDVFLRKLFALFIFVFGVSEIYIAVKSIKKEKNG